MIKLFSSETINKHWFLISISVILCITIFLRFYNFQHRWGLGYDQAHDVIVASFAIENGKIPLVGPFSSAGPFQTGGEWYWFLMLGITIFPGTVLGPWLLLGFLSVLFVLLLIYFGKEFFNERFGLLVGLLAAFSPAQIFQSLNLTNQSPIAFIALLTMFASLRYKRTKRTRYLFFLGFFASLATSIHLQGALLFILLVVTLMISGRMTFKGIIVLLVGIFIPFIPILVFDVQNDFINSRNILRYYLHDQYRISLDVLGRRWLTVITEFWPKVISNILGGNTFASVILLVLFVFEVISKVVSRKITKEVYIFIISLLGMVVVLRYIRTPIFDSYIVFMHPLIFVLLGWMLYSLVTINRLMILFVLLLIAGNLYLIIPSVFHSENTTVVRAEKIIDLLDKKYKDQKFAFFDYEYTSVAYSFPLVLYLQQRNKISDDGYRLGLDGKARPDSYSHPEILGDKGISNLRDLEASSTSELAKEGWAFINPSQVYHSTQEWRN